ncbi:hypothetical protein BT69DRAFT_1286685 [Atractiella rhizophila]|nr:hypothetical protein BT69DRAFT_1286685 [Atractiella rhizophila]
MRLAWSASLLLLGQSAALSKDDILSVFSSNAEVDLVGVEAKIHEFVGYTLVVVANDSHALVSLTPSDYLPLEAVGYLVFGSGTSIADGELVAASPSSGTSSFWDISSVRLDASSSTLQALTSHSLTPLPSLSTETTATFLRPLSPLSSSTSLSDSLSLSHEQSIFWAVSLTPLPLIVTSAFYSGTFKLDLSTPYTQEKRVGINVGWNRLNRFIAVHATLMASAFLIISPLAIFIARYRRSRTSWFPTHATIQIITLTFVITAFTVIRVGAGSKHLWYGPHERLGLFLFSLVLLQAILGSISYRFLSPNTRRVFIPNWVHLLLGITIQVLATAQIPLGFKQWEDLGLDGKHVPVAVKVVVGLVVAGEWIAYAVGVVWWDWKSFIGWPKRDSALFEMHQAEGYTTYEEVKNQRNPAAEQKGTS